MAIDNPIDQARFLAESDARGKHPLMRYLKPVGNFASAVAKVGLAFKGITSPTAAIGAVAEAAKSLSEIVADDNSAYLQEIIFEDLKYLEEKYGELSEQHRNFLDNEFVSLWVDADRKARASRGREKVSRIGAILRVASQKGALVPPDDTEELMRVAQLLDDREVLVLEALVSAQGESLNQNEGRVPRHTAASLWPLPRLKAIGLSSGDLFSCCSKLDGLGLITEAIPRNYNNTYDEPGPYALLRKGYSFVEFIRANPSSQ